MSDIAKNIKNIGQDAEAKTKTSKGNAEDEIFLLELFSKS